MLFSDGYDLREYKSEDFVELYDETAEEFIAKYEEDIISIDLTGKVLVAVESAWAWGNDFPVEIKAILVPEEQRYGYKATLIYAGHIAFVKLEYKDGRETRYLIKDDECEPSTLAELIHYESSIVYQCEKQNYTIEDMLEQIEMIIRSKYNFKYKLKRDNIIFLEGL